MMKLERVTVTTKINGTYESIISLLGNEVNSFDIVNVDINDTSQMVTILESTQILITDFVLLSWRHWWLYHREIALSLTLRTARNSDSSAQPTTTILSHSNFDPTPALALYRSTHTGNDSARVGPWLIVHSSTRRLLAGNHTCTKHTNRANYLGPVPRIVASEQTLIKVTCHVCHRSLCLQPTCCGRIQGQIGAQLSARLPESQNIINIDVNMVFPLISTDLPCTHQCSLSSLSSIHTVMDMDT